MDWENAQFIILYENFRIYFVNFGYKAKILTFFSIDSILQAKRTRKNCVFGGCIGKMAETPPLWCVRHARLYGNLAQGFSASSIFFILKAFPNEFSDGIEGVVLRPIRVDVA